MADIWLNDPDAFDLKEVNGEVSILHVMSPQEVTIFMNEDSAIALARALNAQMAYRERIRKGIRKQFGSDGAA